LSVNLAYYSIESGWIEVKSESDVVAELGQVTAPIDHFTTFAILAKLPAPAAFELSNLSITTSERKIWELVPLVVRTGKEATITVDATNNGGIPDNYVAILKINDVAKESRVISIEPGQTQKIVFTVEDNEPGTYVVEIGNLSGEFESALRTNWWLILGLAAAFGLILWLVLKRVL